MILTLHSSDTIVHVDITADQFMELRNPSITQSEIEKIASNCGVDSEILIQYAADLQKSAKEMLEIDGSCDYSDHL
ncbi:hypothetical protein [Sulfuricurvum sp.]|uniref:hypothetical protein n=1 Tax=Sulfuricurvum sp. TaxID=2025608 RepID=UPI003C3661EB